MPPIPQWHNRTRSSSGPFTGYPASNLSVGSSVLATSPLQAHLARVSTLSGPDTSWSGIRPVIHDAPAEGPVTTGRGFPLPFGYRHLLLGPSQSRSGSSAFLTVGLPDTSFDARTPSGLPHSTRARYGRGGCLLYPGDGGALPAECRPRPAPAASQRPAPTPRQHTSHRQGPLYETSTKVHAIHRRVARAHCCARAP